jgi:selenocysteine lyase/cysteine desulfurase
MSTVPITTTEYAASAHRYYGGTQSLGLWKGVGAAIDFMNAIGMEHVHNRVKGLGQYTQESLLQLGGRLELLTPTEDRSRCGVNGFRIKNMSYDKFFKLCMENKVRIRGVAENGLNSLRVSTHIYNTKADVDRLMDLVRKVA